MCRIICIHWHFVCIYEFIRTWYCCCTNLFTNYWVKLSVCVSLIWSNWILTNNWSLCLTWLLLATSRLAIASPITWTGINYLGFVLIILVKLLFSFLGDWLAIVWFVWFSLFTKVSFKIIMSLTWLRSCVFTWAPLWVCSFFFNYELLSWICIHQYISRLLLLLGLLYLIFFQSFFRLVACQLWVWCTLW